MKRVELLAGQLAERDELPATRLPHRRGKRELAAWQRGDARPYAQRTIPALFDEVVARHAERTAARRVHGTGRTQAATALADLRGLAGRAGRQKRRRRGRARHARDLFARNVAGSVQLLYIIKYV